jgi:iron complex outermembrane receptor protein
MTKIGLFGAGSALAFAAGLWAPQALAAEAAAETTAPSAVAEITVVAEKREAKIETVPVAITAFSSKQRDIIGARTVQEISDFTPGLSYYAIADRAYIRGIGRNTVNLATAAGVAIYYNNIYYGANGSVSYQHDSLFIGNVEIDRGPQNALHGSNADGGVINYISNKPTKSFYAEARAGLQTYGYYSGEGVVSGPLTDNWRFRVGGQYSAQNDGYFHNLIGPNEGGAGPQGNGGKWYYAEAQLEGTIGEHLDVYGIVSTADFNTNFHTVATKGPIPETRTLVAGAGGLYPSDFYGLCAINHAPECVPAGFPSSVVPGSAVGFPVLASSFPGNNPSTADIHTYLESSRQHNTENRNVAIQTSLTYHLPSADIQYFGGYQTFYYHLFFGPGLDSGLSKYSIQGCNPLFVIIGCPAGPTYNNTDIFPAAAGTLFIEDDQSFSHELNILSTGSSPFQYIAGGYWFHEHFKQPIGAGCTPFQPQAFAPVEPNLIIGGVINTVPTRTLAPPNGDGCFFNQNGIITYDDYAGYLHASYKFSPEFNIEGGIRYTSDYRRGFETQRLILFTGIAGITIPLIPGVVAGNSPGDLNGEAFDFTKILDGGILASPPPAGAGPAKILPDGNIERSLSHSWGAFTGDATLNWTPDPTTLAYFKYARGYKAGGFAAGTFEGNAAQGAAAFTDPEFVDAFELGLKKTVGSVLTVNLAGFYYTFHNDQQPLGVVGGGGVVTTQLFNIPTVRDWGVELEGVWRPIDPLTLSLQYSYLNAKVTSMNGKCVVDSADPNGVLPGENHNCPVGSPAGAQNIVGFTLPESPPNKVSLNGQYVFNFDPGKLTFSASFIWKDQTYGEIFNQPLNLAPSYYQLNLRAIWNDAKDRYTVIFFANNVTDQTGFDNVTQTRLGTGTTLANIHLVQGVGVTAPLVVGGEVQVRFR